MVNEWTSNDVPLLSSLDLYNKHPEMDFGGKQFGAALALEAMVEHLNEHYPKPAPVSREDAALADRLERQATSIARLQGELETAERDRSSWRRAHGIVEQERITARQQLAEAQVERDSWRDRAEAAEARTAVTREDVEKCVYGSRRAGRECDSQGFVPVHIQEAVERLFDLFGVSAGQATDPVEQLAEQIESATREAILQVCADLESVAPDLDPLTVERAMDVTSASRCLAAHVLGQEAEDA